MIKTQLYSRRGVLRQTIGATLAGVVAELLNAEARASHCSRYLSRGYCTDYIRSKLGSRTPRGNAINYPITGRTPRVGSVAVFNLALPFGHVAWVESVDERRRVFTVTHWNFGSRWVNRSCGVTDKFGILSRSTFSYDNPRLRGFFYP